MRSVESANGSTRSSLPARPSQNPYDALNPRAMIADSTCTNLTSTYASMRESLCRCAGEREREAERRAFGLARVEPDASAVRLDDPPARVQADAGPAYARRIADAHVWLEDPTAILERDARPLIGDADDGLVALALEAHG